MDLLPLILIIPISLPPVNLVNTINNIFGPNSAVAIDSTSIRVMGPIDPDQKVAFVAALENLEVERGEAVAKVIINSRTGTVVIGSQVQVDEAAVAHGSLTVTISEDTFVSQPGPFSRSGETAVVADSSVYIEEEDNRMFLFQPGVSLNDLVRAVNQVGASPQRFGCNIGGAAASRCTACATGSNLI